MAAEAKRIRPGVVFNQGTTCARPRRRAASRISPGPALCTLWQPPPP